MSDSDRRPLIVLLLVGLLALALFGAGAVGAARAPRAEADGSWFGARLGGRLDPGDVRVTSGACSVTGGIVTFTGGCALEVARVEGGFPWSDAVRRAVLRATTGPVVVTMRVQGRSLRTTLDPDESVRLVFTRDGGPLGLGCVALGGCAVALLEDSGP